MDPSITVTLDDKVQFGALVLPRGPLESLFRTERFRHVATLDYATAHTVTRKTSNYEMRLRKERNTFNDFTLFVCTKNVSEAITFGAKTLLTLFFHLHHADVLKISPVSHASVLTGLFKEWDSLLCTLTQPKMHYHRELYHSFAEKLLTLTPGGLQRLLTERIFAPKYMRVTLSSAQVQVFRKHMLFRLSSRMTVNHTNVACVNALGVSRTPEIY